MPIISTHTNVATFPKLVLFFLLNTHSFWHNLFKVVVLILRCPLTNKEFHFLFFFLNSLNNSSVQGVLQARGRQSYVIFITLVTNLLSLTLFSEFQLFSQSAKLIKKKSPSSDFFFLFMLQILFCSKQDQRYDKLPVIQTF